MKKLILDVDTGTDDAVAIMSAALHPDLELVACTTVNGNVPVTNCTENTLRVLDHIGASHIPVYEGAPHPIVRPDFPIPRAARTTTTTNTMHGEYLDLPAATSKKQDTHAVDFLVDYYMGPDGPATALVPVGPLTNIAMAIDREPRIVERIPTLVIMGGSHEFGNVSSQAEFNIWGDPEAAKVVIASGVKSVVLVPLDCTHEAVVSDKDCDDFAALKTPAGDAANLFIMRRIRAHDEDQPLVVPHTAAVHDAVCICYLITPEVLTKTGEYFVDVETEGTLTMGRTCIDTHARSGKKPNVKVALGGDAKIFTDFLKSTFARNLLTENQSPSPALA